MGFPERFKQAGPLEGFPQRIFRIFRVLGRVTSEFLEDKASILKRDLLVLGRSEGMYPGIILRFDLSPTRIYPLTTSRPPS